jgi:hypothetical protein
MCARGALMVAGSARDRRLAETMRALGVCHGEARAGSPAQGGAFVVV